MAFAYYSPVTVQSGQVPSAQTDFPMLVSYTDARLKTVGNGGHVQNANGYDIRPYSDSGLTSAMTFELEYYNASTGQVVMWVKVGSLADASVVYLAYGDAALNTNGSSTSTWDSNYTGVYHYPDGSTLSQTDSTSNGYNGTSVGTMTAITGKIDGGIGCNRTGTNYSDTGNSQFADANSFTFEAWVFSSAWDSAVGGLVGQGLDGFGSGWNIDFQISGSGNKPSLATVFGPTATGSNNPFSGQTNTWHYIVGNYNSGGGGTTLVYIDGTQAATASGTNAGRSSTKGIIVGFTATGSGYNGNMDEVRISNSVRSANYITTVYNNTNAPSTFAVLGTEVPATTTNYALAWHRMV